jgi:hypothetical protein
MPYQKQFPFAKGSHTSWLAACSQMGKRAPKTKRYLEFLYNLGPLTDHEAHNLMRAELRIAPSSLQSIRNNAMDCMLVREGREKRLSPYGLPCNTYELTEAGKLAVDAMREVAA